METRIVRSLRTVVKTTDEGFESESRRCSNQLSYGTAWLCRRESNPQPSNDDVLRNGSQSCVVKAATKWWPEAFPQGNRTLETLNGVPQTHWTEPMDSEPAVAVIWFLTDRRRDNSDGSHYKYVIRVCSRSVRNAGGSRTHFVRVAIGCLAIWLQRFVARGVAASVFRSVVVSKSSRRD